MRQRTALCMVAVVVACSITAAAPAAQQRNQVIRMGEGIGKVQLGMTMQRVRRAFGGRHDVVYRGQNFGARGRYVELGWERPGRTAWEPAIWRIGFRSTSRRGPLRVTRVGTTARSERTPKRIGTGSRSRQVVSAYPRATCVVRGASLADPGGWIVVEERTGGMTAFRIVNLEPGGPGPGRYEVQEVVVQRQWFSRGGSHDSLPRGAQPWCP